MMFPYITPQVQDEWFMCVGKLQTNLVVRITVMPLHLSELSTNLDMWFHTDTNNTIDTT